MAALKNIYVRIAKVSVAPCPFQGVSRRATHLHGCDRERLGLRSKPNEFIARAAALQNIYVRVAKVRVAPCPFPGVSRRATHVHGC